MYFWELECLGLVALNLAPNVDGAEIQREEQREL